MEWLIKDFSETRIELNTLHFWSCGFWIVRTPLSFFSLDVWGSIMNPRRISSHAYSNFHEHASTRCTHNSFSHNEYSSIYNIYINEMFLVRCMRTDVLSMDRWTKYGCTTMITDQSLRTCCHDNSALGHTVSIVVSIVVSPFINGPPASVHEEIGDSGHFESQLLCNSCLHFLWWSLGFLKYCVQRSPLNISEH